MKKDNQFVAMTHKLCPICAKKVDEGIVIHMRFGDLSKIHDKATGFGPPCEECQTGIDMGAIMVVLIDGDKSGEKLENYYRCGIIHGIREQAIRDWLGEGEYLNAALKMRALFVDYRVAKEIGLPVEGYPPQST